MEVSQQFRTTIKDAKQVAQGRELQVQTCQQDATNLQLHNLVIDYIISNYQIHVLLHIYHSEIENTLTNEDRRWSRMICV